jgi:hypothetical protein
MAQAVTLRTYGLAGEKASFMGSPLEIHRIGAHVILPAGRNAMSFKIDKLACTA